MNEYVSRVQTSLPNQLPKTLIEPLPILQVVPVERHRLKLQGMLPTPVYVTAQRRNAMGVGLVFEARIAVLPDQVKTTKGRVASWAA